jgi:hypothetical protein
MRDSAARRRRSSIPQSPAKSRARGTGPAQNWRARFICAGRRSRLRSPVTASTSGASRSPGAGMSASTGGRWSPRPPCPSVAASSRCSHTKLARAQAQPGSRRDRVRRDGPSGAGGGPHAGLRRRAATRHRQAHVAPRGSPTREPALPCSRAIAFAERPYAAVATPRQRLTCADTASSRSSRTRRSRSVKSRPVRARPRRPPGSSPQPPRGSRRTRRPTHRAS